MLKSQHGCGLARGYFLFILQFFRPTDLTFIIIYTTKAPSNPPSNFVLELEKIDYTAKFGDFMGGISGGKIIPF